MKLSWIGNFGKIEKVVAEEATLNKIIGFMDSLDWKEFHQVVLEKDSDNWIEVGGSLERDGFSAVISHDKEQFVISHAPASVSEMKRMLIMYFQGDTSITEVYFFPGLSKPLPKRFSMDLILKEEKQRFRRWILASGILLLLILLFYFVLNEQTKLWGKEKDFVRAEVVDKKWKPAFLGYYLYEINYSFTHSGISYSGKTKAGHSSKRDLKPGDPIQVSFDLEHPENNAYVARIVKKTNLSSESPGSRSFKQKLDKAN